MSLPAKKHSINLFLLTRKQISEKLGITQKSLTNIINTHGVDYTEINNRQMMYNPAQVMKIARLVDQLLKIYTPIEIEKIVYVPLKTIVTFEVYPSKMNLLTD